jgi:hypothetical protein
MALPTFTLGDSSQLQPDVVSRPNALPDTALGHGPVVEEDRQPETSLAHGAVVDDNSVVSALQPERVIQEAKLEAGFSILRSLINGPETPAANGQQASAKANAKQGQTSDGLAVLGSLLGF